MMNVQNLKRHNKSYHVSFIDGENQEQTFVVSEDLVVKHRLLKGKLLDETAFRVFLKDVEIDEWMQKAKSYVLRYSKNEAQTKTYLETKIKDDGAIQAIIDELKRLRLIDDQSLIEERINTLVLIKKEGPIKLRYTLQSMGFDEAMYEPLMASLSEKTYQANLQALFDKKMPSLNRKPVQKAMGLMKQYLVQKGYSIDDCDRFVNQRSTLFYQTIDDRLLLKEEAERIQKKLKKQELDPKTYRDKLMHTLLEKGFRYDTVKAYMEGR